MMPRPISENPAYIGDCKLTGKAAIITGGDSGIGRAAAIAFAKEGCDVAIVYLDEHRMPRKRNGASNSWAAAASWFRLICGKRRRRASPFTRRCRRSAVWMCS
ncbi:SDR family NAD(P)-dependent oxidoreductase [Paenibacillus sp. P25]|nr:SDR family NAD(P)-dependent oxidoreductase [Paenibacillus sp. P25]